jgi:cytochrome c oxidase subunit 2
MTRAGDRPWKEPLRLALALMISSSVSCAGSQSALDAAGPGAGHIQGLWWIFFYVSAAVWFLVVVVLTVGVLRAKQRKFPSDSLAGAPGDLVVSKVEPQSGRERRLGGIVAGATALTVIILFALLVSSFFTGRAISVAPELLVDNIEVIGHQWWWEIRYNDATPANIFTTANEIHIPVGRPVQLKLVSRDVIHSFWVPNLHGKKDLIPGHDSVLVLQADRPGLFRGQCAEYCGLQHAHMSLVVIAEPPDQFDNWLSGQRQDGIQPASESEKRGQQVFLSSPCITCHTIAGTPAGAKVAPDLTHIGTRQTIAAGTLPNTRTDLGRWVVNSQSVKPGNKMPPNSIGSEDLESLLDYLQSLK